MALPEYPLGHDPGKKGSGQEPAGSAIPARTMRVAANRGDEGCMRWPSEDKGYLAAYRRERTRPTALPARSSGRCCGHRSRRGSGVNSLSHNGAAYKGSAICWQVLVDPRATNAPHYPREAWLKVAAEPLGRGCRRQGGNRRPRRRGRARWRKRRWRREGRRQDDSGCRPLKERENGTNRGNQPRLQHTPRLQRRRKRLCRPGTCGRP